MPETTDTAPNPALSPALCRSRAAFMRVRARKAEAEDLKASFLVVAADWERLASEAEVAAAEVAAAEAAAAQAPPS